MTALEVPSKPMASSLAHEHDALIERICSLANQYVAAGEPPGLTDFIRAFYGDMSTEDLASRRVEDLAGAARSLWRSATVRAPKAVLVRAYNPQPSVDGWSSPHTILEVVCDDMPFIVDSVTMALDRRRCTVELSVHPIVAVVRDAAGHLLAVSPSPTASAIGIDDDNLVATSVIESFAHFEIDRITDPSELSDITTEISRVIDDVRKATSDWVKMLASLRSVASDLARRPPLVAPDELIESRALLEWMADHHFTMLGTCEYLVGADGTLIANPDTGLGILREPPADPITSAPGTALLVISKNPTRATVHRDAYLDSVAVRKFADDGSVIGEWRCIGLWTSAAYNSSPVDIPMLRHKVASVVRTAGYPANSHAGKDLIAILETYPRDELFQISESDLFNNATGILQLHERRKVRVFTRTDEARSFATALVFVPRDRYTTTVRERIDSILTRSFHALGSEWTVRVTESVLARVHFVLRTDPNHTIHPDIAAIEAEITACIRSWPDELAAALEHEFGDTHGPALARRYSEALPASYRDEVSAIDALADIGALEQLRGQDTTVVRLDPPDATDTMTFTVFANRQLPLSEVMPILVNLGVTVLDEHPYHVRTTDGEVWVERFRLRSATDVSLLTQAADAFEAAFIAVLDGRAENDSYGSLVLSGGCTWREAAVLRAYARYLRQVGTPFSDTYLASVLQDHPKFAAAFIDLFHARFDPDLEATQRDLDSRCAVIIAMLDDVASLDDDRILRSFLALINATLRTNWFQSDRADPTSPTPSHIAFKIDPALVPDLPKPAPLYEIFVYSPRVEGIHLRMGKVARGGLRWSDRREDFRTEVLGLVKAQTVKNAVIVPVGSKGGFVAKQLPPPSDRDAWLAEGIEAYKIFVGALLDLTDNLVEGTVVAPQRVVRYDGDDTYLVVAADKGTATFSDIANSIAIERGYWLGDAFASGGSVGYDHKAMGITARGAWESVKAHFRSIGIDVQSHPFTAVGIGDMSGDVFGNGMLLSRELRLVAAFDHRHIFIDPNPDAEQSFVERERLFHLPRSSWADYDTTLISAGGGVHPRSAKQISLSPEVRATLGIEASVESLTPNELVQCILTAEVDLLWNGGIGTYVKATTERHAEVGDKANDTLRIDACELRTKVVGEGGNLGLTQLARIEFALRGGLINTDAIDNSAGVDTSDHEVNLKILLDGMIARSELSATDRNPLLASMTDDVASLVLRDNYDQNRALALACAQAAPMADVHIRYLDDLEAAGRLDRAIEFLPTSEQLAERAAAGRGLTSPEFAVVLAYTKIVMASEVEHSDLVQDPDVASLLVDYFPAALQGRASGAFELHPLRDQIIATSAVNAMVNLAGTSLTFRMQQETGATIAEVVRAHFVATRIFDQRSVWTAVASLDNMVAPHIQTEMYLESRKLLERATRWLLRSRWRESPVRASLEFFSDGVQRCSEFLGALLRGDEQDWVESATNRFQAAGVAYEIANRIANLDSLFTTLDIVETAAAVQRSVNDVAAVRTVVGDRLHIDWLRDRIVEDLARGDRWQALARNALREDAYREHRAITAAVLEGAQAGDTADSAFDRWTAIHATAIQRSQAVISDVRAAATYNLATLSVALRELRNLTA